MAMKKLGLRDNELRAVLELKAALEERFRILDFRVFGSRARGEAVPDSDVDVMIVVDSCTPEVESVVDDLVFEINLSYDCFISTVIFGKNELEKGPLSESPLYKVVVEEGIKV